MNSADWPHEGDCDGSLCGYCGCCMHTPSGNHCKVNDAPMGMSCANRDCGCEGRS